jgi:hypothetical protein
MNGQRDYTWVLAAIFFVALILKLYFSTQSYLIHNIDAGYYVKHIGEIFTQGYPQVIDPPLAFYYAAAFVSVFGMMLGFKVAIALVSAGIAFPAYKIAERLGGNTAVGLLAAFFAAFSPTNMFMMGDLLKNEVGLFFGAWFVYFLIRTTDGFTFRNAALTVLFAGLMIGSHFSTSGYIVFSIAPFLAIFPAYRYWKKKPFEKEHIFCLGMLAVLLAAGLMIILLKGWDVSSGEVGVVGLYGRGDISGSLIGEYSIFLIPAFLALAMMERKRQMLFAPWLAVAFLLSQSLFVRPEWAGRFIWDSYFPVAILTALGAGYFWKDWKAFIGVSIVLLLFVSAGFVESAQRTHPIIETGEWKGLLELDERHPGIGFGMVNGGLEYWVEAAGFDVGPDGEFTLICVSENVGTNHWLNDGCMQSAAVVPPFLAGEIEAQERIGRFLLVRIDQLPEEFGRGHEPPPDLNPPPQ